MILWDQNHRYDSPTILERDDIARNRMTELEAKNLLGDEEAIPRFRRIF